jgi:uncharacterized protein YdiU (UPF0061 family)
MNLSQIKQPFTEIFPGDFSEKTMQRQTPKVLFSTVEPVKFSDVKLIHFNKNLAQEIGLGDYNENSDLQFLAAQNLSENIKTYATAYAGHQFGNWAGQLGDGRAIFAGEIQNNEGNSTELQWKGAGATPYSRSADGRAVLRSSVREYLMSEAMHHLKIPTTRALSLCFTGENVLRDIMYNGNSAYEKGAIVMRTAESFLRFGHFELISAQKEIPLLKKLADYTIKKYFPEITSENSQKYKDFFETVCKKTAELMVDWLRVGFVHGVMNTDNMSILGLSIDFGPFSMVDEFDLNFTPNTTDLPRRRYAFGKQPQVSQWNLWQLANALQPLIDDTDFLEKTLENFSSYFWELNDEMMAKKLGFDEIIDGDEQIIIENQKIMTDLKLDYTLFFNHLEKFAENGNSHDFNFDEVSYINLNDEDRNKVFLFLDKCSERWLKNASGKANLTFMKTSNPKFILRNYLLFECIEKLENGNSELFDELWQALQNPYEEIFAKFSAKRPDKYNDVAGCSMLSCSS